MEKTTMYMMKRRLLGQESLLRGQTCLFQVGDFIGLLDLEDPSAVRKAVLLEGNFPQLGSPTPIPSEVQQCCAASVNAAYMVLMRYEHHIDAICHLYGSIKHEPHNRPYMTIYST